MKFFLLEDNLHEAAYFSSCLGDRGHQVAHFTTSVDLLDALRSGRPGAVVLDWMLPDVDGFVTLRRVRELCGAALPVVMLSGLDRADSIVQAFDAGADDYLLKPMTRPVLIARLESLLRRLVASPSADAPQPLTISNGPYHIDFNAHVMRLHGEAVALTPKELDLAWTLFSNAERFVSKAELVACVWGKRAEISPHTITQHVHVLRSKLRLREHGFRLSAVYGSGYRLTAAAAAEPAGNNGSAASMARPDPDLASGVGPAGDHPHASTRKPVADLR